MTATTIFIAAATVTLALGVPRSFSTIISASTSGLYTDVVVRRTAAITDADATGIINSAGRPARVVGELDQNVAVPDIGDPVLARLFRCDPAQLGFLLYSGRWYNGPVQAAAARALIEDADLL